MDQSLVEKQPIGIVAGLVSALISAALFLILYYSLSYVGFALYHSFDLYIPSSEIFLVPYAVGVGAAIYLIKHQNAAKGKIYTKKYYIIVLVTTIIVHLLIIGSLIFLFLSSLGSLNSGI